MFEEGRRTGSSIFQELIGVGIVSCVIVRKWSAMRFICQADLRAPLVVVLKLTTIVTSHLLPSRQDTRPEPDKCTYTSL